ELHTAYGSTRMLVVDLADPTATLTTGPDWAGAKVVRADGHRRWIRVARAQVIALPIVEPDIEDVIRRIYRGEIPPATDGRDAFGSTGPAPRAPSAASACACRPARG